MWKFCGKAQFRQSFDLSETLRKLCLSAKFHRDISLNYGIKLLVYPKVFRVTHSKRRGEYFSSETIQIFIQYWINFRFVANFYLASHPASCNQLILKLNDTLLKKIRKPIMVYSQSWYIVCSGVLAPLFCEGHLDIGYTPFFP